MPNTTKLSVLNAFDLDGRWQWLYQFFLAAFYGAFLLIVGKTLASWLYGIGISAAVEFAAMVCVTISAALLWMIVLKASRRTSIRSLNHLLEESRDTIAGILQSNDDLESELFNQSEDLAALRFRFKIILEKFKISAFQCDRNHRYLWAQNFMMPTDDILGKSDEDIMPPDVAAKLHALKAAALLDTAIHECEIQLKQDGRWFSYNVQVAACKNAEGDVIGTTMISMDVTEQFAARQHLAMMLREVNHRVSNSLSIVLSICNLSSGYYRTVDGFMGSLSGRVNSLAKSNSLLSDASWHGIDGHKLIERQLGHFSPETLGRIRISGPHTPLWPKAIQTIGLTVHELMLQAIESGLFETPTGRIEIDWSVSIERDKRVLAFSWACIAEPAAILNDANGFSTLFLERIAGRDLGGQSQITITDKGWIFNLRGKEETVAEQADQAADVRSHPFAHENRVRCQFDRELIAAEMQ